MPALDNNCYYVYIYLDLDNIPFYVGKGKGARYKIYYHLQQHYINPFLENKIRKVGVDNVVIKFPYKDLTEEQAFYLEDYYIAGYGRRDLDLGPLCNLTNGGDGPSPSKETRRKISESLKGCKRSEEFKQKISNANKGKYFSDESKRKVSEANKGNSPWIKDKHHSEESKRKMREAQKGKPGTRNGAKHTEESKQRMRESWKLRRNKIKGTL